MLPCHHWTTRAIIIPINFLRAPMTSPEYQPPPEIGPAALNFICSDIGKLQYHVLFAYKSQTQCLLVTLKDFIGFQLAQCIFFFFGISI